MHGGIIIILVIIIILGILIDLDILEREVPVTETHPEKSKWGLYRINDHFLQFWFRFVYPDKARLELGDTEYVLENIRARFIDSHVSFVYEAVCQSEMWQLARQEQLTFNKIGRWWNHQEEIDIVALDSGGNDIIFGECKYCLQPMDVGYDLDRMIRGRIDYEYHV